MISILAQIINVIGNFRYKEGMVPSRLDKKSSSALIIAVQTGGASTEIKETR
jgi:siroheme synthase (precorrin-2 oxidase/ferrochelatase)